MRTRSWVSRCVVRTLVICVALSLGLFAASAVGAEEKAKPAASNGAKPVVVSPDGSSTLDFGLTAQTYFEYLDKDMGEDVNREYTSTFRWRRIRPTMTGTLLDGDLKFYFHVNVVPGSLEFMDYYLDYKALPDLRIRVGQCKIPFTRYRIQSFKNLQFVDWAIVTKYFGAERQAGIALHNGYEKPARFEYEVGLYTGMNSRKSHAIGISTVSGEAITNPSDLVDGYAMDEFHPAVALHLAYNHGGIVTSYETDFEGGGFRFSGGASAVWDANPVAYRDAALRVAPEFLVKAYGFAASANYYLSFYEKDGEMDDTKFAMTGGVAQVSYLIRQFVEVSARGANVATDGDFRDDALERATEIIAGAADEDEAAALSSQYKKAGLMEQEREVTVGVNVYLVKRTVKLQNDVSYLQYLNRYDDNREDFRYRSQLQLAF